MTIPELLSTKMYRNNQSFLARELNLNRNTFRKYMNDSLGKFHIIREFDGELEFFTNQSNKITGV